MKKIFLIIILAVTTFTVAFSQTPAKEVTPEKDYSVYFPKQGDFALGLDLNNILDYIGNSIYNTVKNDEISDNNLFRSTIFGKYFLSENMAIRGRLGIGVNNSKTRNFILDDRAFAMDPFSELQTIDTRIYRNHGAELGLGVELRRSLWRLQGYVGAELFFGYQREKISYEYGNELTTLNHFPSTTVFENGENLFNDSDLIYNAGDERILQYKDRNILNYGAALVVGVDYFVMRNFSLGLDFKLEGRASYNNEQSAITESIKAGNLYTMERRITPTGTSFRMRPMFNFRFMFYF